LETELFSFPPPQTRPGVTSEVSLIAQRPGGRKTHSKLGRMPGILSFSLCHPALFAPWSGVER